MSKPDRSGKYSHLYRTKGWRKLRARQLQLEPLCAFCLKRGQVTPATVCDHIEPHRGDMGKFWSGPFQSLCDSCHSSDKARIESGTPRAEFTADGRVIW